MSVRSQSLPIPSFVSPVFFCPFVGQIVAAGARMRVDIRERFVFLFEIQEYLRKRCVFEDIRVVSRMECVLIAEHFGIVA